MIDRFDKRWLFQMENALFEQFDMVEVFAEFFHYEKAKDLNEFSQDTFLHFCWDINVHCLYGFQCTNTEQWLKLYKDHKQQFKQYFVSCDPYIVEQIGEVIIDYKPDYCFSTIEQLIEDADGDIDIVEMLVSYVLEQYYFVTEIVDV